MARKAKTPSVTGPNSRSYVMPSFWGLTGGPWTKIEKLSEEQAKMMQRYQKLSKERMALLDELSYQQQQFEAARVEAARFDKDDPDDKFVKITEQALERVEQKQEALRRASQLADNEYHQALQELRSADGIVEKLVEEGKRHHEDYLNHVAAAEKAREEMGIYLGLSRFVAGQQQEFGTPPNDPVGNPWWRQPRVVWPGDPEPDLTISTQSAPGLLG